MNFRHVWGLTLRYTYLYKRSLPRLLEIIFWPLMDLLVWGFLTVYLTGAGGAAPGLVTFLIGAMIFWDIFYRAQQGVALAIVEDIWGRSLLNVFIAPVRMSEVIAATYVVGFFKIILTVSIMATLALAFYDFNLLQMGFSLLPFFANLLLTGWAVGLITTAFILRFGQAVEALAWGIPFLLQPFSAVFYPVSVLPFWLQPVAWCLPSTYVFEGMREVLRTGQLDGSMLAWAFGLNLIYMIGGGIFFNWMVQQARVRGLLAKLGTQ